MTLSFIQPAFLWICFALPVIWYVMYRPWGRLQSRGQRFLIGGLHSLILLLAAMALSQPHWHLISDKVNLFFVLDVSDSVRATEESVALQYIEQTVAGMDGEDQAGLIVFGKQPLLEMPLKQDYSPELLHSAVNTNFTNIYDALQLALGKLPEQEHNRIVLISDGNENIHQAEDMSFLANSLGAEIYTLPLESWEDKNEVYIEKLESPAQVPLDAPFEIRILASSLKESESDLIILRNDQLIANHKVLLHPGKNIFRLIDNIPTSGIYSYKTIINPGEDSIYQNNEGLAFTYATRKSGILYLADTAEPTPLMQALQDQGFQIDMMAAHEIPETMNDIIDYKAIILDNVPGSKFSDRDMENLEKYVKDIGGGLLMVGGNKSFGAGGYRRTPVEKALPVMMDLPTERVYSSLSIIFLIDKSNSMAGRLGSQNKLEAAKVAVFSAVELLNPKDQVGMITFDSEHDWAVPFTSANNRQTIAAQLLTLVADGGTKLYGGLAEAISTLQGLSSIKKHIIILSDGEIFDVREGTDPLHSLINRAVGANITVSTVAVGESADVALMKLVAELGKGRNYMVNDAGNIPRIFVDEIKIVTRKVILEKELQPILEHNTALTEGYTDTDFPSILGMDLTYPKPEAEIPLKTTEGPLLATKQYGLGKSMAFTSDLSGRWGKNWLTWDQYGPFVNRMVKWVEKKETSGQYSVEIERTGEEGIFLVDVTDTDNRFKNALNLKLNILFPDQTQSNEVITLEQIAPGKYQGHFPVEATGAYYLNLYEQNAGQVANSQTFGYGIPYTSEFQNQKINVALLTRLAENTGGRLLGPEDDLATLFQT